MKDNEIFLSQFYKLFRLDRTRETHPLGVNDPSKYRANGGGVLIAVKTDLDVQSKHIKLKCRAELLSVEINFGNNRKLCVSKKYS